MIAVATAQTHIKGYSITAYKGTAQGETYLALLQDAEALGANAVLNTCFDDALDVERLYHGAAVVIEAIPKHLPESVPSAGGSDRNPPDHETLAN